MLERFQPLSLTAFSLSKADVLQLKKNVTGISYMGSSTFLNNSENDQMHFTRIFKNSLTMLTTNKL